MISKSGLRLLVFAIRYCSFLGVIPYYWDGKSGRVRLCTSYFRIGVWLIIFVANILHYIFLLWVFVQNLLRPGVKLDEYMVHCIFIFAYTVSTLFAVTTILKRREIFAALNGFIAYNENLRAKFVKKRGQKFKLGCELLIVLLILTVIFDPYIVEGFNLTNPHWAMFISSYFPKEAFSGINIVWMLAPHTWMLVVAWALALFYGTFFILYISSVMFLTNELRANKPSKYTKNQLRTPWIAVHTFRCLQVLTRTANNITRDYLLIIQNNMIMCFTVGSLSTFVRYHAILPMFIIIALTADVCMGVIAIMVIYIHLGNYHERSKKLIGSWKRCIKTRGVDRKLLSKYLRSCRVIRIELGTMGYYQKPTSIRVIGKIIYYVSKVLMMTKKYS